MIDPTEYLKPVWRDIDDETPKGKWLELWIPDRRKSLPKFTVARFGAALVGGKGWFNEQGERVSGTPTHWRIPQPPGDAT